MQNLQSIPLPTSRQGIADVVEQLIAILDDMDGDLDLEDTREDDECPGDREPSLCRGGYYLNGKVEEDLELDTSDSEHSLGWITRDTGAVFHGGNTDAEWDIQDVPHDVTVEL